MWKQAVTSLSTALSFMKPTAQLAWDVTSGRGSSWRCLWSTRLGVDGRFWSRALALLGFNLPHLTFVLGFLISF